MSQTKNDGAGIVGLFIVIAILIVCLLFHYHAQRNAVNAQLQQLQDQQSGQYAPVSTPTMYPTPSTPKQPSSTSCNSTGLGGQVCTTINGDGNSTQTFCSSNGLGGYNCY